MALLSAFSLWASLCAAVSAPGDSAKPAAALTGGLGWYTVTSAGVLFDKAGPYALSGGICQSPITALGPIPAGPYYIVSGFWSSEFSAGLSRDREAVSAASVAPGVLRLYRNYPNPFRQATRITYDIPVAATISLTVYDAAGRQVGELVRGPKNAGRYSATWDGTDKAGRRCPSGLYFCLLEDGHQEVVQKMLVAE